MQVGQQPLVKQAPNLFLGLGFFNLSGISFVSLKQGNLASGQNDVYTVPAGKKALVLAQLFNPTIGPISWTPYAKSGGVYYRIGNTFSISSLGGANFQGSFVFEAGESLALSFTALGINVFARVILFDASDGLKTARLAAFSAGDNVLYTAPTGKQAIPVTFSGAGLSNAGQCFYLNDSGNSRVVKWHDVAAAGAAGATNQLNQATIINGSGNIANYEIFAEGQMAVINVDVGTAVQFAFLTVWEY
jgi:hypothetical protein